MWPCGSSISDPCYVHVDLQAACAVVVLITAAGDYISRSSMERCRRPVVALDYARMGFAALLIVASLVGVLLGLLQKGEVTDDEMEGAGIRAGTTLVLALWDRSEARRSLQGSAFFRMCWVLVFLARIPLVVLPFTQSQTIRKPEIALLFVEVALALGSVVAVFMVPDPSRRDPALLDDEDAERPVDRTVSNRGPSPESQVSLFGFLAFSWFTPIVDLAEQRDRERSKLEPSDVYKLLDEDTGRRQLERLDHHWQAELRLPQPSLGRALNRAFRWEVLGTAWIKLINDTLTFVGPFLLNKIIAHVQSGSTDTIGYVYAITMVMSSAMQAFMMAHYFQMGYRTGMRIRAALILMSYRKALRVLPWPTPAPPQQAPPPQPQGRGWFRRRQPRQKPPPGVGGMGQMTNLISADTDKFTFLMPYFNLIWSAPLQMVICFGMLFLYVQWALFAGLVMMAFFTCISSYVQNKARKVQAECMKAKDERLKLEVELLKIVKIIKLYAWEDTIEARVKVLRNKEMALQLRYKLWSTGVFLSFSLSPTFVALATFTCYTMWMEKDLTAATAFTALSLFNILTFPLAMIPMMARFLAEAQVAKDRLEAFFLAPEVAPRPQPSPKDNVAVALQASRLVWPDKSELLGKVNIEVQTGEILVIVGRTGCGKSGLLYALLGELPIDPELGRAHLKGTVGYCAQTAWVRNATLRDNITGGHVDEQRYQAVLDACALRADIEVLPQGDQTAIGDRGINLSGGQKQRVALARAVYANPDVYILDDVLSALDAHVASHICNNLIKGDLLKGKTVVLVTHSRRAVPLADHVLALGDKEVAFYGTYEEFRTSGVMDQLEEAQREMSSDSVTDSVQEDPSGKGAKGGGKGDGKGDGKGAGKGGGKGSEVAAAGKGGGKGGGKGDASKPGGQQEERRQGAVTWSVYMAYAKACGGAVPVFAFLASVACSEGARNLSDGYLTVWTNKGGASNGAAAYAAAAFVSVAAGMSYVLIRVFVGQVGSRRLHEGCVRALLRAQMSFFDLTPTGQILNRLAEDTNILDYNLPQTMAANLVWFWRSASIVVVCMLVEWYLAALIIPMFILYARLAKRYLPATRDLRRLDAAARSPIFSHFAETMAGVSTVRAMQQQEKMFTTKLHKLETQMEAYYLSNTAARWLSLRLQFNGTVLVAAVSILGIALSQKRTISAALVGLAISYALKLTDTLNQVNRESADRETQMVSVERVHHYITTMPQEAPLRLAGPPLVDASWPSRGEVKLTDVTMKYRPELPLVLNGISLDIKSGERVGIVGRTGCGKSSFLMVLMRLVEILDGSVAIDGVDTRRVGLHDLREKAAIIPQDPAILTGTVRFNLDPFSARTDQDLWDVLEKAQLKARVEAAGGLDSKVEEGGGNYSVGELQLMCLARALLRRQATGGLLLLDEATSALDAETDQIIQHVIRTDFKCTTITVAHRIQTLLDYDRVVVLEAGRVVEFDSPQELLKRPSQFQALAREGGVQC